MGTKSVREIIESALRAQLVAQTELTGVNVYKGLEVAVDALPAIVVSCESVGSPPDLNDNLGNFLCTVNVAIYSSADESTALSVHRDRQAATMGAMQDVSGIKSLFTSQGDATCYDVTFTGLEDGRGDRSLGTMLSYSVLIVLPA